MTGLNALKAPCIDDPAYLAVARQIASHPQDPYGFDQFWQNRPQPANEILAPPVLPYWLGVGIYLFDERPTLLKIWLFPIALVLTLSMQALLRRFARGFETPILVGLIFSPAVLPGFNFMLDVPALALSLCAAAVFLRGLDRGSWGLALLAGVIAGLAAQTKYTGATSWPLILVAALIYRRPFLGVLAVAVAAGLFAGWEAYTAWLYGESHLQIAMKGSQSIWQKHWLPFSFQQLIGALGAPLGALAAAALWRRPHWALIMLLACAATLSAMVVIPDDKWSAWVKVSQHRGDGQTRVLFATWGFTLELLALLAMLRLAFRGRWWSPSLRLRRPAALLMTWLALECAGYAAMTPFPAARRVLGPLVVATLVLAHLASRSCRSAYGRWSVSLAAAGSVAAGLLFAGIDIVDSYFEPDAIRDAATFIRARDPQPRIWMTGHWGTQYAAARESFRPLVPGESVLQPGDWLIDAPTWVAKQEFSCEPLGEPAHVVVLDRGLRLRTLPPYYGGMQAIEWWPRPMLEVRIYHVRERWVPRLIHPDD